MSIPSYEETVLLGKVALHMLAWIVPIGVGALALYKLDEKFGWNFL